MYRVCMLCYKNHFFFPRFFYVPLFYNSSSLERKKKFFIIPQPIYTFLQYYYQVFLLISLALLLNLYICTNVSCHFHTKSFTFCSLPFSFCVIVNFIFMKMTIYVMCKLFHANILVLTM